MGKSPDQIDPGELDNHGKPALVVDRQGYIHLVFGSHGGDPKYGRNPLGEFFMGTKGKMTHVVSVKPGDISAWRVVDNIPVHGTYNQWVKVPNGDLYLFYRHGGHRSDWVYQKSIDDGRTFAAPVSVLKHKVSAASPTVNDSWYAWFDNGRGDTITASYIYHPCANPKHNAHRQNTYFMQLDTQSGQWSNVQGARLALPVTKESADQLTLIEDTGTVRTTHGTATWMPPADRTWFSLRARMCGIIAGTEKPGRNPSRSAQRANACTTVTSLSIRRPACECSWRRRPRPVTKLRGGIRRTAD